MTVLANVGYLLAVAFFSVAFGQFFWTCVVLESERVRAVHKVAAEMGDFFAAARKERVLLWRVADNVVYLVPGLVLLGLARAGGYELFISAGVACLGVTSGAVAAVWADGSSDEKKSQAAEAPVQSST